MFTVSDYWSFFFLSFIKSDIPTSFINIHVYLKKQYLYKLKIFLFIYTDNLAIKDPVLRKAKPWAFQTREEQYETALWKNIYMNKKLKELTLTEPSERFYYTE
jgi:hypothetical protein